MTARPDDPQAMTTALSTLAARVAVLERWMRRSQRRRRAALFGLAIIGLAVCLAWLSMR